MWQDAPLFPESASTISDSVDQLYGFLVAVSLFFSVLIAALVLFFAVRYRRRKGVLAARIHGSVQLEILWSLIPLGLSLVMFFWGAKLYFAALDPPAGAMDVYVTGKQWMWKLQHPTGQREINTLHVPVGVPVRLTMTSEDVIHDFYVPAFRMKRDVLPGRYTIAWFEATKVGEYHLFCAEYCGTKHSEMVGKVVVMEEYDYERWLTGVAAGETPQQAGQRLFESMRCNTCHSGVDGARGPTLDGAFGKPVQLRDGRVVLFDEDYTRESILKPNAAVVAGYESIMPTYDGQLSEDQLMQLLAYIKSLGAQAAPAAGQEGGQ